MELFWICFGVFFKCFSKHTLIFTLKLCAESSMYPFGSCFKGTLPHILFLVLLICYLFMLALKLRATFYKAALSFPVTLSIFQP